MRVPIARTGKQPKDKEFGQDVPGTSPIRRDISDPSPGMSRTKTLCKAPFSAGRPGIRKTLCKKTLVREKGKGVGRVGWGPAKEPTSQ